MNKDNIKSRLHTFSQKLDDQARDEYYNTPEARIDTLIGGDSKFYMQLRSVKREYDDLRESQTIELFPQWLNQTYGIQMKMEDLGLGLTYQVVDEQKYTIFLLKFGR